MSSSLDKELIFLILQYLEDEKFKETQHKLEQECGFFFNMKYFEEKVMNGEWEEVEKYVGGFIKLHDNRYSTRTFFEIRKQKYFEALDSQDKPKALDILVKDLKKFSTINQELYQEITQLLTLDNFRENEQLSEYGNTRSVRSMVLSELKKLIEGNPLTRDKLILPSFEASRLRTLINQSFNWQHQLCMNPRPNPDIKTLLTDHTCSPPATPVTLPVTAVAKPSSSYAPLGGPFQPAPTAAHVNTIAGWITNANSSSCIQTPASAASSMPGPSNQVSVLRHSRIPSNTLGMMDYQNINREQQIKRSRPSQSVEEVTYPAQPQQPSLSLDDLPRTVVCTLHQGSTVTSMDFHPSVHSLLAVGCGNGEISLWEAGMKEKLTSKPFKIKDIAACSVYFQAVIAKDSSIAVNRVSWSPNGNFIGVAFTKHLVHLYAYQRPNDLHQNLEIDAHIGGVNDLAFSCPDKRLCIITCGDDKLIKVWDLNGRKLFNFEGHEAPVYSVCPHQKEGIQFIFSTSVDGKIKAWLYDNLGSRLDYDAPGQWCTKLLYSADGSRLFSCGTSKDGDSFLVEWNDKEGALKRTYSGFRKKSAGVVQFDTTKNCFLAVGEDNQIKFWNMDNINVLTSIDAEGGLPSLPCLRFNKEGNLLAVTTANGGLKVLADTDGMKYSREIGARFHEVSKSLVDTKSGVDSMARSTEKQTSLDDVADKSKARELVEIVDPVHCRTLTMPDSNDPTNKVARLLYTNSGDGLLALGAKGIQKLWKWSRNEQNSSGKATARVVPQHWQPKSGRLMTNDVPDNSEEAVPCIALSKNDHYVMSACGGKISLFNTTTLKGVASFMSPPHPPSSTFLAFHPKDNNIIAIGMEDATIHLYDARAGKVKSILKGHQKRITGLAFSTQLNILVSSSADAELFFWSIDSWEEKDSLSIQLPDGNAPVGDTRVYFHSDQVHLLVCLESHSRLFIYDPSKMEEIQQWVPQDGLSGSISSATYSCNSQLVYVAFTDGNIGVFDADRLRLRCRIASSAYLHQTSSNSQNVYPLVVAAHPQELNQFAVGLSDGSIKVIEPIDGRWGVSASVDNVVCIDLT
ncbi:topless-related protein 2 [Gastrolobium bilobum]|uniref:topless-related protein 2 n=1 Tax=Gastrolobium bilobum TaxID=150636 RepID=UPI002AB1995F|nr:topless-related protein 2 [Gastrolobium bilobum]